MLNADWRDKRADSERDGRRTSLLLVTVLTGLLGLSLFNPHAALADNCPTINYVGNEPGDAPSDWDWLEGMQGVAHYGEGPGPSGGWYFTNLGWLRKVPHANNLDSRGPFVAQVGIPDVLSQLGYNHFGDLDAYRGFLFVPVTVAPRVEGRTPALAVFRESDLGFVGYKLLVESASNGGWVAVNHLDGFLYTSNSTIGPTPGDDRSVLFSYSIDIEALRRTGNIENSVRFQGDVALYEPDGYPLRTPLRWMQGGVFTPWGDLVLVNGGANTSDSEIRGGIHVFAPRGGTPPNTFWIGLRLIQEFGGLSSTGITSQGAEFEEVEGLDWKTLGGRWGDLHLVVVDHDRLSCLDEPPDHEGDDLYFKHYAVSYAACDELQPRVLSLAAVLLPLL